MDFAALRRTLQAQGKGVWALVIVLVVLLIFACFIAYAGWNSADGTDVPASGYIALALGVVLSLGVGFGLMALVFYSSRQGYDEPPHLIDDDTPPD
jgi:TRAP-type C4-dicarboxylate transport system permease small subunit